MQQGRNSSKPKSLYIMKAIKQIGKVILVIIACVAFVLMGAETNDGGICLPWTLGWLAALAISARLLDRMGAFNNN